MCACICGYIRSTSETATRLSREVCVWLLTTPTSTSGNPVYLPHVLLRLLHLCNRSVANEEVALSAVAVMLNLATNASLTDSHMIWWQKQSSESGRGADDSCSEAVCESVVEFLFASLHRLSRAKPGTLVREMGHALLDFLLG